MNEFLFAVAMIAAVCVCLVFLGVAMMLIGRPGRSFRGWLWRTGEDISESGAAGLLLCVVVAGIGAVGYAGVQAFGGGL